MVDQENHKKTIDNYKSDYEFYTGKASDINRNLALGGIAVIWIFKNTSKLDLSIPDELVMPLIFLVFALALDLFQYICGGLIWFIFYKRKEKQVKKGKIKMNDDIEAPTILPFIIHLFYWSKIIVTIIAYIMLLTFLYYKYIQ